MNLTTLIENAEPQNFIFVDTDDQEVMDGAWAIAEESGINILSDMELMGAIVPNGERIAEEGPNAQDIVGAWFGGARDGGDVFSFDIVVDPAYQGNGISKLLFKDAMGAAQDYPETRLTIVNKRLEGIASRSGFVIDGGEWVRSNY